MLPKFRDISNLNNFDLFPLCRPAGSGTRVPFEDCLGFTEDEVQDVLFNCGINDKLVYFQGMYNGYSTGTNRKLYCPFSIVKALTPYLKYLEPYWVDATSTGVIVPRLMSRYPEWPKISIRLLEICAQPLDKARFTGSLAKFLRMKLVSRSADALWTYMYYAGYLSAVPIDLDVEEDIRSPRPDIDVEFFVPNTEVMMAWMIFFQESMFETSTIDDLEHAVRYLIKGELDKLVEPLQRAGASFSFMAQPPVDLHECYYRMVLAAFLSRDLAKKYKVISCVECGDGKPDITAIPLARHLLKFMPVTFELKALRHSAAVTYKEKAAKLETLVAAACNQIIDKAYHDTNHFQEYSQLYQVGIAFCGTSCAVRYRILTRKNGRAVDPIGTPFSNFVPPFVRADPTASDGSTEAVVRSAETSTTVWRTPRLR